MNDNEEKEYNDIESLAAYLHSGKMQEQKSAEERAEMGLPPESDDTRSGGDLESVLFSVKGRNRRSGSAAYMEQLSDNNEDEPVRAVRHTAKRTHIDPSIPANPIISGAASGNSRTKTEHSGKPALRSEIKSGSIAEDMKKKLGAFAEGAKKKFGDIKESVTDHFEPDESELSDERADKADERPSHVSPSRPVRHRKSVSHTESPGAEVPGLAASLSEALGEKAAEIVESQKNALPADDIPEVFDVEEGTEEAESFDKTATRLMNAVNDPQARSVSMKDEAEVEEEETRAERIMAARMRLNYERQKQSTRTLAYILISLLLCAAILGAAAYASTYIVKWALDFTGVASTEFRVDITIPDDADIETVAAILSENNIINDAKFFRMYADFADKLKKNTDKKDFIGGKYTVSSTMSYSTLLSMLRTKENIRKTVDVRIVEGMTAREIGELLEENNVCFAEDFEKYYHNIQNNYEFERRVKENSLKYNQLEGYLFPDTYQFYVVNAMENGGKPDKNQTAAEAYDKMKKASEDNALEAARTMYSNFNSKMTRSMYKKMGEMHLTLDETMALASMVQKEAASEEDMGNVASVFLNRIRHSEEFPYLQSDVTVLYVENDIKPFIKGSDAAKQRIYNAYNTYICQGIPAGAVCNPGTAAINAVLYAPETPYYYFCANEETGEIYYAQTHEEHEQNLLLAGLTAGDQVSPMPYGEGEENG